MANQTKSKHSPAELLAAALDGEPLFHTSCMRCGHAFHEEVIERRVYETDLGLALAAFCERCAAALPRGGEADIQFRAHLERQALASAPPLGNA